MNYSDFYRNKRPTKAVQPAPAFASAQWPQNHNMSYMQNGGMSFMLGGKPAENNFQNSFGTPNFQEPTDYSASQPSPPMMQQPTFHPQRRNFYTGLPSGPGSSDGNPFGFLLNAMGGGYGMPGRSNPIKVPPGVDPKQWVNMTPEQRASIPPYPGEGYELISAPVMRPGQPFSTSWQWRPKAPAANFRNNF